MVLLFNKVTVTSFDVLIFRVFTLPYFFVYKTEFFYPNQDGSRSLGLFRKGKMGIIAKFYRTDLVI